jgi:hypothetical protein
MLSEDISGLMGQQVGDPDPLSIGEIAADEGHHVIVFDATAEAQKLEVILVVFESGFFGCGLAIIIKIIIASTSEMIPDGEKGSIGIEFM